MRVWLWVAIGLTVNVATSQARPIAAVPSSGLPPTAAPTETKTVPAVTIPAPAATTATPAPTARVPDPVMPRVWTHVNGKTFEGVFIDLTNELVHLYRPSDGKDTRVALANLCQADQDYVKQQVQLTKADDLTADDAGAATTAATVTSPAAPVVPVVPVAPPTVAPATVKSVATSVPAPPPQVPVNFVKPTATAKPVAKPAAAPKKSASDDDVPASTGGSNPGGAVKGKIHGFINGDHSISP